MIEKADMDEAFALNMRDKTYDKKCRDLAEHFLSDEPELNCDINADDLAKQIQACIDEWLDTAADFAVTEE